MPTAPLPAMKYRIFSIALLFLLTRDVGCYPSGAPFGACSSMKPSHNETSPQTGVLPFVVIATLSDDNDSVTVTIKEEKETIPFRGFLLQAYYINDTFIRDGAFTVLENNKDNHKLLACNGGTENSLTHSNRTKKLSVTTSWTPPPNIHTNVMFKATVVEKYDKFWLGVLSNTVLVKSSLTVKPTMPIEVSTGYVQKNIYSQCGSSKGCFGLPSNCFEKQECEVILSYHVVNRSVQFELAGALGSKIGWIAMGLSQDSKMGDDSVTECVMIGGEIVVRESWNIDKPEKNNTVLGKGNSTSEEEGNYEDGIITCSWKRPFVTTVQSRNFDLLNKDYHILLAKGPVDTKGNKGKHTEFLASAQSVNLTSIALVAGKSTLLIKIHGSFMTAAWVGFVSIAILLARHYKEVWTKYKLCGTAVWFSVHRCFMLLSVALAVSAFIAIFIDVDGWSNVGKNPHPIIGCISTGLIAIQPLIAICRPKPLSPNRPIFRWIHGLIGNGAQIIAIVNMFFAVSLKGSNLPRAFYWVMVTFIIFHCLVHLLIHLHSCFMERERGRESSVKPNQFQVGDGYEINEDAPGSSFKKFALGLYTMVNIGLTAALVLMICLS